ncbi:MAG: MBOAT family protein, partial [Eubacterium sp.]|nr:MBOAT family protein [Eubacterium sp.]
GEYMKALFGIGTPLVTDMALYDVISYGIFILILAFASTSISLRKIGWKLQAKKCSHALVAIWSVAILALVLPLLIRSSYNPFLYFRF